MNGTVIAIALIVITIGAILWAVFRAGGNTQKLKRAENDLKAAERVTDAIAHAPNSHDATVGELRHGGEL